MSDAIKDNNLLKEKANNNNDIEKESNPINIKQLTYLTIDSFSYWYRDNTFTVFKSINDIFYLIFSNKNKSIISYDLINNKKAIEIKKAHKNYITSFRHINDLINKRDLIISISCNDNDIKLWNVNNFECILDIKHIYIEDLTACFLNYSNQIYIITGNRHYSSTRPDLIRIYDLKGKKIKEIKNSNDNISFIDSYYDNKLLNTYIITGNTKNCKSFDYKENKVYNIYTDPKDDYISSSSIIINNKEEIVKLIAACYCGYIKIWDFHSGKLLNVIYIINEYNYLGSICLYDNNYLLVSCINDIKIVDLEKRKIIGNIKGHNDKVVTIKKINHPYYKECLISQGVKDDNIKIWIEK